MKSYIKEIIAIFVVAAFVGIGSLSSYAFTPPTGVAPANNSAVPLDTSSTPQTKGGGTLVSGELLNINGAILTNYLYAWNNFTANVGLTVESLSASAIGDAGWTQGYRPVCIDTSHKLHICAPSCGNGFVEQGEQCDDNNPYDGDGCSSACQDVPVQHQVTANSVNSPAQATAITRVYIEGGTTVPSSISVNSQTSSSAFFTTTFSGITTVQVDVTYPNGDGYLQTGGRITLTDSFGNYFCRDDMQTTTYDFNNVTFGGPGPVSITISPLFC